MAELAEAFEQHLRSLSDDEWRALETRVRSVKAPPPSSAPLPNERERDDDEASRRTRNSQAGFDEAVRRGYIGADGKPVKR